MSALPIPPLDDRHLPPVQPIRPERRWKRAVLWSLGGVLLLFLLVVIGVFALLHSSKFHSYALNTAQEKATAALGSQVRVQNYVLTWSGISPKLELFGVVIQGASSYASPLLQADRMGVQVQVTSLLRRTWYIDDISVDHPIVHLYVDKNGNNNIPKPKSSGEKSNTDVFDLGIRHVSLKNGEIYYNDQKSELNADLHEIGLQSGFSTAQQSYAGSLGYRNGHLKFGEYSPLPHDFQTDFAATRQQFVLKNAVMNVGASRLVLNATVTDYENPKLDANYQATVDAGEFRAILKNPSVPTGIIHTQGTAQFALVAGQPALTAAKVNGEIRSPSLTILTPGVRTTVRNVRANYALADGNADIRNIQAGILGGQLNAALSMKNLTGASRSHLQANLRDVSLAELRGMINSPAMQQVSLAGTANATAKADWGKTLDDLSARADATLNAELSPMSGETNAVPVNGVIHGHYDATTKQVTLTQSYVRTPQTSLTLNGTVSDRSRLEVNLQARDLRELETIATMFRTSTPGGSTEPLGLAGTASFVGSVTGSTATPHIVGELAANNLQAKGTTWRVIRTGIDASPSQARFSNGMLQPAERGRINFDLAAGLTKWSFTSNSPIDLKLNGTNLNVADITRAAGVTTPISGTLNANVAVRGTQLNPVGQGTLSLTRAKVANETIESVNLKFQGTGDQVKTNLVLKMPAGTANGDITIFPKQRTYDAVLRAVNFQLGQLATVKEKDIQLTGVLNLDALGRGSFENPQLQLTASVPELRVRDQKLSDLNLRAAVANHVANVTLDSNVLNTSIHGKGTVNLTDDYYANATLDTEVIPLGPLVDLYAPAQAGNVNGQTEMHATLKGSLKNKSQLDAHVIVPSLNVNYKNAIQLGAVNPIRVDLVNGVLQLQRSQIRGTGTDLQFQGSIPLNNAPASLLMLGTIDLRLAQLYDPAITSSGQLRLNINSYGQTNDPNVQGRIDIVNASFASGDLPVGLQNGNGVLTLTKDRLNITEFRGEVGGGTVTASGGVIYRPTTQFDLALKGTGIRVLIPQGIRTGVETQLALSGNLQNAILRGQVRVDQLSFTPDFDLMDFAGSLGGETTPPPTQGFSQALQLDIGVQSTNNINLVSRTLSVQGSADLNVRGTAAQPVILGRVNLSGGDLIFSGNRYLLQGGTIQFVNPSRTEPVVNLGVNTTIQQYNIAMQFWGPVDHLHTSYTSDPALPPSDIINLIAFGKTSEANAANPTPPGALGAESLIASQVSSQLTSRVEKIAGISQLSIDPVLGGGGRSPSARIAIQQRVTSKIFVTFATDVTSTQRQAIKLEYQASPRVSYSGTRDQNGGFGFDVRIRKTW